ncbi:HD domain-containing phosphohydrolase [Murimonas intestini]|uniref:Diguanylate cyclase (GGDEF)-like protein/putative nucleotidyltransferase with HDIG domain n=1 Tax=Murimonas intestini TaxID=1337051 RepID=A0AB73T523_9FIRM|nr:HD domain-containing phosphohydrolase [Murimonas intestini]MCR1840726.1 diguanylate cyclase [Murimonas intestini]MCR1865222.1 diguanylate cyclase [Murimonas intestini]MCR1883067.1 diguanylate cyclase [Murimonas intestini]
MYSFGWIPITALFCYVFLFFAFAAAKKTKVIKSFMVLLMVMVLWTGGSLAMRLQLWPSVEFWYHVSLLGVFFLPCTFMGFIMDFLDIRKKACRIFGQVFFLGSYILNLFTGIFLPPPSVVEGSAKGVQFVYDFSWPIIIPFAVAGCLLGIMVYYIFRGCKGNMVLKKQLTPILAGIVILFTGHMCLMIPFFKGFPIDVLSGVFNAFFMFYALYSKRLFKLTLLISRWNCYIASAVISIVLFYQSIPVMGKFARESLKMSESVAIMAIAALYMISTIVLYTVMKRFLDNIFVREELVQTENLKEFSHAVSKTLDIDEILASMVDVIRKTIEVNKIYICIEDLNGNYVIKRSTSPLDENSFLLRADHPIIQYLKKTDGSLMMKDFKRTIGYKSMWESEKRQLQEWRIECFVALKDEEDLEGLVMLSEKPRHSSFTYDDMSFLTSVGSVSSMAVKNSRLYEKAYEEARKDELTGLLNRKSFYEVIEEAYEANKESSLALAILNIDDFKLYNQLYGAAEGDIALQKIAQIIKSTVGENGYVARYGGKEFALILPRFDLYSARNLAENVCSQIKELNRYSGEYSMKALTMSGGVCAIPYTASNVQELISNADLAVYTVKRSGKNAVMVYSEGQAKRGEEATALRSKSSYNEYASTIYALTAAIDTKDHYTFSHSKNVAYYAGELARGFGMNDECIDIVKEAGLLHDIGKIGIQEDILNKPGKLTAEEYEIMKTHVENSIGIIRHLPSLDYVIPAVIGHHERYDGKGYPRRIAGEDIPLMARILCIADSFDAMISVRSYKASMPVERAFAILEEEAGKQFDPKLVPVFINLVKSGTIKIAEG